MKNLFVIDASGYIYRAYFAIRNMTNDKGESTNALFGFIRSFLKLVKDFHPDHCVAVFDGPNNSQTRSTIYPAYKAHRSSMPPDLLYQMSWAQEFCQMYGLSTLSVAGVEADDTIGSIAIWGAKQGAKVYLCSSDKDLCQLVNEQIVMLDSFKENVILGPLEVENKFGVPPHLVVDFLSLTGDSSDNVPGIPGIGPKTAAELLKLFGSLDALIANVDNIPFKKKETIKEHAAEALLSKRLVLLDTAIEFPQDPAFFALKPIDKESLKKFYASMRFNTLIRELETQNVEETPTEPTPKGNYHLVNTEAELQQLIEHLSIQTAICIDTETTDPHPLLAKLVGIGLGVAPEEAWYVPFNGAIAQDKIVSLLKPLLSNPSISFYGHNLKYDSHVLSQSGLPISLFGFDTLLASYLLNTHIRKHSLDELVLEYFGYVKTSIASLIGKGKQQINVADVSFEKMAAFCCEDVDYTMRLKLKLEPEIEKRGLQKLYYDLELPLTEVLTKMEAKGIYLDATILRSFGTELAQDLELKSQEIYAMAGEEFNLNSPQQISRILFEKMGIYPPKGASTSTDVLEILKNSYPIAGKIQEYRVLEKLRSTYVDVLPDLVHTVSKRIHTTFNQSVAATGRLSSQDPNLQNIPVRSEIGLKIREAFRPEKEGWSFLAADYSQIELRLLAHLSEDPILLTAFKNNEDIHQYTASVVFHVPLEEVTKEMRFRAKAVNFGVLYGQGAYGLSQNLGISQKEATQFIDTYFKQYPKVKAYLESCKDSARITGRSVTLTGRERLIPEILSKNIQIRNAAERLAVNTPFQGSAADLIKIAMLQIQEEIERQNLQGFMILQIHDELIFEVPDQEIEIFKKLVKDKMEHVIELKVPLLVDLQVGKNWKEC